MLVSAVPEVVDQATAAIFSNDPEALGGSPSEETPGYVGSEVHGSDSETLASPARQEDLAPANDDEIASEPKAVSSCSFMNPTERKLFKIFKGFQFFMTTWYFCSWFLPNHPGVLSIMSNPGLATSVTFLLSGILTHMRYRPLMDTSAREEPHTVVVTENRSNEMSLLTFRERFEIFLKLRFGTFSLLWVLAILAGLVAGVNLWEKQLMTSVTWELTKLVSTFFGVSSLLSVSPFSGPGQHSDMWMQNPPLQIGSSLILCWLMYPAMVYFGGKYLSVRSSSAGPYDRVDRILAQKILLWSLIFVFCFAAPWLFCNFLSRQDFKGFDLGHDNKWHHQPIGTAIFFLNPIWKFPQFLAGVLLAEEASLRGYFKCDSADVTQVHQEIKENARFYKRWLMGPLFDVSLVVGYLLLNYRNGDTRPPQVFTRGYLLPCLPTTFLAGSVFGESNSAHYKMIVPTFGFPFVSLWMFLAMHPFAYRSATGFLLGQVPLQGVLAGRVALIIGMFACPLFHCVPEHMQTQVRAGAGIFVTMFGLFVFSVPLYYYVFQPFQVLVAAKTSTQIDQVLLRAANARVISEVMNSSTATATTMASDVDPESSLRHRGGKGAYEIGSTLRLGFKNTPQYDPFDLKDSKVDRQIHLAMASLTMPSLFPPKSYPWRLAKFAWSALVTPPAFYSKGD